MPEMTPDRAAELLITALDAYDQRPPVEDMPWQERMRGANGQKGFVDFFKGMDAPAREEVRVALKTIGVRNPEQLDDILIINLEADRDRLIGLKQISLFPTDRTEYNASKEQILLKERMSGSDVSVIRLDRGLNALGIEYRYDDNDNIVINGADNVKKFSAAYRRELPAGPAEAWDMIVEDLAPTGAEEAQRKIASIPESAIEYSPQGPYEGAPLLVISDRTLSISNHLRPLRISISEEVVGENGDICIDDPDSIEKFRRAYGRDLPVKGQHRVTNEQEDLTHEVERQQRAEVNSFGNEIDEKILQRLQKRGIEIEDAMDTVAAAMLSIELGNVQPKGKNFAIKGFFAKMEPQERKDTILALEMEGIKNKARRGYDLVVDGETLERLADKYNADIRILRDDEKAYSNVVGGMNKQEAADVLIGLLDNKQQGWAAGLSGDAADVPGFFEGMNKYQANRALSALKSLGIDPVVRVGDNLTVLTAQSVNKLRAVNDMRPQEAAPETAPEANGQGATVAITNGPQVLTGGHTVVGITQHKARVLSANEPYAQFSVRGETGVIGDGADRGKYQVQYNGNAYLLEDTDNATFQSQGIRKIKGGPLEVNGKKFEYADEQGFMLDSKGKRVQKDMLVGVQQVAEGVQAFTTSSMLGVTEMFKDKKTGESKTGVRDAALFTAMSAFAINAGPSLLTGLTSTAASVATGVAASGMLPWMAPVALVVGYGMYQYAKQNDKENGGKGLGLSDMNTTKLMTMAAMGVATTMAFTWGLPALGVTTAIASVIAGGEMSWSNKVESQRTATRGQEPVRT